MNDTVFNINSMAAERESAKRESAKRESAKRESTEKESTERESAKRKSTEKESELLKYNETMYLKKNTVLQNMFYELKNNNIIIDTVLQSHIINNEYKEIDELISNNPGINNFHRFLKQFFYNAYYAEHKITNEQLQKLLGIQQVRWSIDPNNCCFKNENFEFHYFKDIDAINQNNIIDILANKSSVQNISYIKIELSKLLHNSIWYKETTDKNIYKGSWSGFKPYYGIPESYNFTTVSCMYKPALCFGTVSNATMVNHILKTNTRPFAAHFPDSKSNLCNVHGCTLNVVFNWYHDFYHSSSSLCNYEGTFNYISSFCGVDLSRESISDMLNNQQFQDCLKNKIKNPNVGLVITDTGMIFHQVDPTQYRSTQYLYNNSRKSKDFHGGIPQSGNNVSLKRRNKRKQTKKRLKLKRR